MLWDCLLPATDLGRDFRSTEHIPKGKSVLGRLHSFGDHRSLDRLHGLRRSVEKQGNESGDCILGGLQRERSNLLNHPLDEVEDTLSLCIDREVQGEERQSLELLLRETGESLQGGVCHDDTVDEDEWCGCIWIAFVNGNMEWTRSVSKMIGKDLPSLYAF